MRLTRRHWIAATAAAAFADTERYRVGITTNTRGGWEADVFLSFREARQAGYRYVESFFHYFKAYVDRPDDLARQMRDTGVHFVTISNGGPMEMRFEDPARRSKLLDDHLELVRFIRRFGCSHLKINMGGRRPEGTTESDLRNMSATLNELGRRITAEGLRLGVHAHMWSQFENRKEIDYVMAHTDPQHVWFVLDTGHITMAGIDPVELTRTLGHRIVEFHLKDVMPEHRGGARERRDRNDPMKDPVFFELGTGGVDFPALKAHLDTIGWQGWLTVELDSSPYRPPMESARISRRYLEETLRLSVS